MSYKIHETLLLDFVYIVFQLGLQKDRELARDVSGSSTISIRVNVRCTRDENVRVYIQSEG